MNQVNLHERAVSYGYAVAGGSIERGHIQDAYEKGATEQREIDIERAYEWLVANGYFLVGHKEIKSFKQAMRGE